MIERVEAAAAVDVAPAEYLRLLGYPPGWALEGRAAELAAWARTWYAEHGRPWSYVCQAGRVELTETGVSLDGIGFTSARLRHAVAAGGADSAVLVAVSAGPEAEIEARRLWTAERPDEYFFLEVFGSAVVEHLTTMTGARLCAWADGEGWAVLPHDSPGYPAWDIAEQGALLQLIETYAGRRLPGPLRVLPSGALSPKKSLLAVFGLTRRRDDVRRLTDLVPCENCSYAPCEYRRVPYRRSRSDVRARVPDVARGPERTSEDLGGDAPTVAYTVNVRALRRWAAERLTLTDTADGCVEALFRYEGTTCTNMGRPLLFHYDVTLGPRDEGYPVRGQRCAPAPGDTGHTFMCGYLREGDRLLRAIADERPLAGLPLEAALAWTRAHSSAGCYCDAASRDHKWGLVLETIHYALMQRDRSAAGPPADTKERRDRT